MGLLRWSIREQSGQFIHNKWRRYLVFKQSLSPAAPGLVPGPRFLLRVRLSFPLFLNLPLTGCPSLKKSLTYLKKNLFSAEKVAGQNHAVQHASLASVLFHTPFRAHKTLSILSNMALGPEMLRLTCVPISYPLVGVC